MSAISAPKGSVPKEPLSNVFELPEGGCLVAPTEDMWLVHEQAKPAAIMLRAGLQPKTWDDWKFKYGKAHPELFVWLRSHSDRLPAHIQRAVEEKIPPTLAMHQFRAQSSIKAIADAAVRNEDQRTLTWQPDYAPHVTKQLIWSWQKRFARYPWFDAWLLRGEDPPADVTIATLDQVRRCARAWNFAELCRRIGMNAGTTYPRWIKQGKIPNEWRPWLYGAPAPEGAFVVSAKLRALRQEMSCLKICQAAGLRPAYVWLWQQDPLKKEALAAAVQAAQKLGAPSPPVGVPCWDQLPTRTRKNMWKYALAARPTECRRRAEAEGTYRHQLAEARRCGVEEHLQRYLNREKPYHTMQEWSGLVAKNFFIPTPTMLAFRAEALKEWTEQHIAALTRLPGFDQWFREWTRPGCMDGRRVDWKDVAVIEEARTGKNTLSKKDEPKKPRVALNAASEQLFQSIPLPVQEEETPSGNGAPNRQTDHALLMPGTNSKQGEGFNQTERRILDFVRSNGPFKGATIASRLGCPFNSHFRQILSSLVKRQALRKDLENGYST